MPVDAPQRAPTTTTETAHKYEQGHCCKGDVGHAAPDAQRQQIKKIPAKTDHAESQGDAQQGKGDREAGHKQDR